MINGFKEPEEKDEESAGTIEELKSSWKRGEEAGNRMNEQFENYLDKFTSITPDISPAYLVLLGSILWLASFGLLEYENIWVAVICISYGLVPLSIVFDARNIISKTEWRPYYHLYLLGALIPLIAPLFGFAWLFRRKRKIGKWFNYPE